MFNGIGDEMVSGSLHTLLGEDYSECYNMIMTF